RELPPGRRSILRQRYCSAERFVGSGRGKGTCSLPRAARPREVARAAGDPEGLGDHAKLVDRAAGGAEERTVLVSQLENRAELAGGSVQHLEDSAGRRLGPVGTDADGAAGGDELVE